MIQSMYANLASCLADRPQEAIGNLVSHLRNEFEGRPDSISPLDVQYLGAELLARGRLHVVRHEGAGVEAFWPIPDEWQLLLDGTFQHQYPQLRHKIFDSSIDCPAGARYVPPGLLGYTVEDSAK